VHRQGHFGLALLVFTVGFGLTFTVLNVDSTITSLNLQRARAGSELDVTHLTGLSADAVPALAKAYTSPNESQAVRSRSGSALACFKLLMEYRESPGSWRAYNLAEENAARILNGLDLSSFVFEGAQGNEIKLDDEIVNCRGYND
jgi:hypothetical protein